MRQPALIFGLLLVAALFSACFSYEEGPNFTLKKPTPLLTLATTWQVKEVVKNDQVEITDSFAGDYIDFENEGVLRTFEADRYITQPPFTKSAVINLTVLGTWRLIPDKKNYLEFVYTYEYADLYNSAIVYQEEHYEQWEITRLTEEELWLQNDSLKIKYVPGF